MNDIEPQVKRPVGMTILLVLSLLNAIYQIVSSLFIFILMPAMRQMVETNQMEDLLESNMPMLDPAMCQSLLLSAVSHSLCGFFSRCTQDVST